MGASKGAARGLGLRGQAEREGELGCGEQRSARRADGIWIWRVRATQAVSAAWDVRRSLGTEEYRTVARREDGNGTVEGEGSHEGVLRAAETAAAAAGPHFQSHSLNACCLLQRGSVVGLIRSSRMLGGEVLSHTAQRERGRVLAACVWSLMVVWWGLLADF
jgi:hypothetical protein